MAIAPVFTTTLATATLAGSLAALSSISIAEAAELTFEGKTLDWTEGAMMGDKTFAAGDSVNFIADTEATLGANIVAGSIAIQESVNLILEGQGNRLNAARIDLSGRLTLMDACLGADTRIFKNGMNPGSVIINWGDSAASIDNQLSTFSGQLIINDSAYNLSNNLNLSFLALVGESTLNAGGATYQVPYIYSEGDNTINVASGTAAFAGSMLGDGTITKVGGGTMVIGRGSGYDYFTGSLVINAGTVRWGSTGNDGQAQMSRGNMSFSSIAVNSGATWEDSHIGSDVHNETDVYLNGGTMLAYDMLAPFSNYNSITENYYRNLHVTGTNNTLRFTFKGARRFVQLTSETEGEGAPAAAGLTIVSNSGNDATRVTFDSIRNYNGSITATGANDTHRLYIDDVALDDGYNVTVTAPRADAHNFVKSGAGSISFSANNFYADDVFRVMDGTVTLAGALTAEELLLSHSATSGDAPLSSGTTLAINGAQVAVDYLEVRDDATTLTVGQGTAARFTAHEAASVSGGSVTINGSLASDNDLAVSGGSVTLASNLSSANSMEMSGGELTVSGNFTAQREVSITGGVTSIGAALLKQGNTGAYNNGAILSISGASSDPATVVTIGREAEAKDFSLSGNATVSLGGDLVTDSFSLLGDAQTGSLTFTDSNAVLAVNKSLTMNYSGALNGIDSSRLRLDNGIVLSYRSDAPSLFTINSLNFEGKSVNNISIDVSGVSSEDLARGIDLGISNSLINSINVSQLGGYGVLTANYDTGTVWLSYVGSRPSSVWGSSRWGVKEIASAPTIIKESPWSWSTAGTNPGLYGSAFDDKNFYIAANLTGARVPGDLDDRKPSVFGGAYGTNSIDNTGGTVNRSIWLNLHGRMMLAAGGNFCETTGNGTWHLTGDTHIQATSGSYVNTIVGANFKSKGSPVWTGDGYIAVLPGATIRTSVVGSSVHDAWGTTDYGIPTQRGTHAHFGDVVINIFERQSVDQETDLRDFTITETQEGLSQVIDEYFICGGSYGNGVSQQTGNMTVNVDLGGSMTGSGYFSKSLYGGHNGSQTGTLTVTGDTLVNISNARSVQFGTVRVETVDGHSQRVLVRRHVVGGNQGGGAQTQNGNSAVTITNSPSSQVTGQVVGGQRDGTTSQTQIGNSSVAISNGGGLFSVGQDIVGGSSASASQTQTGDGRILVESARLNCGGNIVAGHYEAPTQARTGNGYLTLNLNGGNVAGKVVGGHYSSEAILTGSQTQTGNAFVSIAAPTEMTTFRDKVIGGHGIDSPAATTTQSLSGDTNVSIAGGTYEKFVIGGHYLYDSEDVPIVETITSTIAGSAKTSISAGLFQATVIGGSHYYSEPAQDRFTAHIGSIQMNLTGGTYRGAGKEEHSNGISIVGGYHHIDLGSPDTQLTVGDINIRMTNVDVRNAIYGGSYLGRESGVDTAPRGNIGIKQGVVTLDILGGTYRGDIFAAGGFYWESDEQGAPNPTQTTIVTEGTQVNLSKIAVLGAAGKSIHISGGYGRGNDSTSADGSIVTGNRTLRFTDAGNYTNLGNAAFYFFDTVDVAQGGRAALNQALQLMGEDITKIGAGELVLSKKNQVDVINVKEGTLTLQGGSRSETMIGRLNVGENGTLDISQGRCGINGDVLLGKSSTLAVNAGDGLAAVMDGTLVWEDAINLVVDGMTPDVEDYEIELFTNLTRDSLAGLDMDTIEGVGYATKAELFVKSDSIGSLGGAYLLLREDGTLVLTNKVRISQYWEGDTGDTWSLDRKDREWTLTDEEKPDSFFMSFARAFFTNDSYNAGDPAHVVQVSGMVDPFSMEFENGKYLLQSKNGEGDSIRLEGSIILSDGEEHDKITDVTIATALETSPRSSIIVEGEESSLTIANNEQVSIYKLDNDGTVTINGGGLSMATGTGNGGILTVDKSLKLGGSSEFEQLTVDGAVTGNDGHILSVGSISSMGSINGGTLNVREGVTTIRESSSLEALAGSGTLTANSALALQRDSAIGKLTADSLALGGRLDVNSALKTNAITFNAMTLSQDEPMVQADKITTLGSANPTLAVTITDEATSKLIAPEGEYWLVKGETNSDGLDLFTVNGGSSYEADSSHYTFTFSVAEQGVKVTSVISNYSFYADNALTENGRAGAKMLDYLFLEGTTLANNPNGDLRKVCDAMDDLLIKKGDRQGADKLAAAAAGSTIATLGSAFTGDMERQLKAIRNRTTTMGLGSGCTAYTDLPYFNAWVNAEGNHQELDSDATYAGYKLDSWGGTVGFDVDMSKSFTCGIALTAMMGDYSADGADEMDGDFDTQYLTLFARYYKRAWVHTFVASAGRADISYDRTVTIPGADAYKCKGDTDGTGFGFMYEVGYVIAINKEATACVQPVVNFTLAHTSIGGFEETGGDAALNAEDMDMTRFILGAGARVQAAVGENLYNRTSLLEARALVKFYGGDDQGEAKNSFILAPGSNGTLKSADTGAVGLEIGAGLTVPVSAESGSIFADVSAEIQSGYTSVNGTIGYRINF